MNEPIPIDDADNDSDSDDAPTLDPPGRISVIGAGPLGIEAALYGRFLGYDVTLLESHGVGHVMLDQADGSLPILPHHCLSPLAIGALSAQAQESIGLILPVTISQWIENALVPLTETDLLTGRVRLGWRVTRIDTIPVEPEYEGEDVSSIPPDYSLTLAGEGEITEQLRAEAVIVAVGKQLTFDVGFSLPAPYYFRIGDGGTADWEESLRSGHQAIVEIFAHLAGRPELDLYRPKRM